MSVNWDKIVRVQQRIKAEQDEKRREWEAADAAYKAKLDEISNFMLNYLNENGMESVKTASGTFFRKEKVIPQGADWDAFYKWVAENDAFDALEKRIKANFVTQYMEEHDGVAPPGVNVFRQWSVGVRKGK